METQRYKHDTQHYTVNMQMNIQPHTHFTNTITIFTDSCIYVEYSGVVQLFDDHLNMRMKICMCLWICVCGQNKVVAKRMTLEGTNKA